MNIKLTLTLTLLVGTFSSFLIASNTNPATKPLMTLSESDLKIIEKAIEKDFKNLSTKDKEKIIEFLLDYSFSAESEKVDRMIKARYEKKKYGASWFWWD